MTLRHRFSVKRLVLRRSKKVTNANPSASELPKPASGKDLVDYINSLPPLSPEDLRDLDQVVRDQHQV